MRERSLSADDWARAVGNKILMCYARLHAIGRLIIHARWLPLALAEQSQFTQYHSQNFQCLIFS
jgi:hypothetical protein